MKHRYTRTLSSGILSSFLAWHDDENIDPLYVESRKPLNMVEQLLSAFASAEIRLKQGRFNEVIKQLSPLVHHKYFEEISFVLAEAELQSGKTGAAKKLLAQLIPEMNDNQRLQRLKVQLMPGQKDRT